MKRLCLLLLLLFISSTSFQLFAQKSDSSKLTLERIYTKHDFTPQFFQQSKWMDDGTGYTVLESSETEGGKDIVYYNAETGEKEILVSAAKLIPEGESIPLKIANYVWSPDKNKLLIFTNTKRVWRYNTRGDYWVLNLETNKLQQLGPDLPESSLMFAKFSPDSKRVGYVSKHNLYVEDIDTGVITQLTFDGSDTIINGTFDWVYEEEFGDRDGFRWSPDGNKIAYWQLDASGIGEFLMINNTDSIYSYTIPVQYPKVGTQNSSCKVGVIDAKGGKTIWMKVPGDKRDNYIARMDWAGNSDAVCMQHFNRPQNTNTIYLGNPESGEVTEIMKDTDEAWVNATEDMQWLNDGKEFLWSSESDGWRHLYLISRDGQNKTLLTKGDYDIVDIELVDLDNGYIYFRASPDNATQRYLFRVPMDGSGKLEKLTPDDLDGFNNYQISPGAKYAIHTYSNFNTPMITDLISLPDHKVVRSLVDNKLLKEKVADLDINKGEFVKVDIGEAVLDGWMIKPPDFDPSKKYPVLFYVYGEPAGQTVLDTWMFNRYLWHQLVAQRGYVVMSVDNRGTPAPRGRDWRKFIYKNIGIGNVADIAAGAKKILDTYSFIDPNRVAIWGWSGGAGSSLNAIFQYPDIFGTAMAVAPVTDLKLYDTIYQERYTGVPGPDNHAYEKGSPVNHAKNLQGNLLLMHGSGDDNVHYQNSERLINELIMNNKIFTFMPFPNRSHGIFEGKNTSRYVREYLLYYLTTHVPAGPMEMN